MIRIAKESPEMYAKTHVYEKCVFCNESTDTWHAKTNNPVCSKCAPLHGTEELKPNGGGRIAIPKKVVVDVRKVAADYAHEKLYFNNDEVDNALCSFIDGAAWEKERAFILLTAAQTVQSGIELLINLTPTGKTRNDLTVLNITILTGIQEYLGLVESQAPKPSEKESRMVSALEEAKLQIEYLQKKFKPTGSGNAVLARIDNALK